MDENNNGAAPMDEQKPEGEMPAAAPAEGEVAA
jgi:hypothetical protein